MRILIDADACPVTKIAEKVAIKENIPLLIFCDVNHVMKSDYGKVITCDAGADSVDLKLINESKKGDIIITQDYGVAALALGKGAFPIHQDGKIYSNDNIDGLLNQRHMAKKARRASTKHHLKGPQKRTEEDNKNFEAALIKLIEDIKKAEV